LYSNITESNLIMRGTTDGTQTLSVWNSNNALSFGSYFFNLLWYACYYDKIK